MGNSHSAKNSPISPTNAARTEVQQNPAGTSNAAKSMSRTASGADLMDRSQAQYHPVEKLGKILAKKCEEERGINGITADIFAVSIL